MDSNEINQQKYENIPGTWAFELKKHFQAFTDSLWITFNKIIEKMNENELPTLTPEEREKFIFQNFRSYILYDMQKRHDADEADRNERRNRHNDEVPLSTD
jgi:hypothetical protein